MGYRDPDHFPGQELGNSFRATLVLCPGPVAVNEFGLGSVLSFQGVDVYDNALSICVVPFFVGSTWAVDVASVFEVGRVRNYGKRDCGVLLIQGCRIFYVVGELSRRAT